MLPRGEGGRIQNLLSWLARGILVPLSPGNGGLIVPFVPAFHFADCVPNRDADQNDYYAPEHLAEEIRTYNRRVHRDEKYIGSKYRTEKRNDDFQCRAEQ